ncbi:hypothetical protein ACHAW5_000639 [Stephanodiscus triporus]|uniref:Uncharacterized protein n=1 Tax=Stephanodiscus triporus TaxID=2934178 RepID=A0ABD3MFK9_9STRA
MMSDDDPRQEREGGCVVVNLIVPPGVEAGVDYLSFEYGGAELEALVPAGSVAGDVLRIQLGNRNGANGDDIASEEDENGGDGSTKPTTSNTLMDGLGGIVLLAVRWRKPDLERAFFQGAEREGLRFELWRELADDHDFGGRRSPCKLKWKEYGDPESDLSNSFFHNRMVSVTGTGITLGQVTERQMELMNDEEYSIFEELQVQVYVGKFTVEKTRSSQKRQWKDG